jgi:hypothetical protein
MIGLVIFLIIIAVIMTLIEVALLTYVLRWSAFRQSLIFAGLANFIGTGIGGLMLFWAASLVFGGAMIGMGFSATDEPRVDNYMWAGVLLFFAILPAIGALRLLLLWVTRLRRGMGLWVYAAASTLVVLLLSVGIGVLSSILSSPRPMP